ncbi:hypothetical protein CONPUDRAFT_59005 [Coniophora puteana RWD-64-598 SS2]|uniref:Uncharacterized protein n=1 Tax=Coniophora puteana (strain RWD-64-598) TaxID=741705 RepID=A0A5M3MKW9_CONPW|nr:uncharacterized protein CONPUDRAFT_59005 [Coniophora puteana RWD-64-598 SS2]EIW79808.1 hypothetical protein CONPUDRAFT_59005 [Coniophora puteana RWD-64-598 SS2]
MPSTRRSKNKTNTNSRRGGPFHFLFRSNLPHRRQSAHNPDVGRRNFFGMSEIFSVVLNPSETVRSLTESKRLLEEARQEINEQRERKQLRTKHTFSPLPGFFPREAETKALERALEGEPSFTVLFGASSVGKVRPLFCSVSLGHQLTLAPDDRPHSSARSSPATSTTCSTLTCAYPASRTYRVCTSASASRWSSTLRTSPSRCRGTRSSRRRRGASRWIFNLVPANVIVLTRQMCSTTG